MLIVVMIALVVYVDVTYFLSQTPPRGAATIVVAQRRDIRYDFIIPRRLHYKSTGQKEEIGIKRNEEKKKFGLRKRLTEYFCSDIITHVRDVQANGH